MAEALGVDRDPSSWLGVGRPSERTLPGLNRGLVPCGWEAIVTFSCMFSRGLSARGLTLAEGYLDLSPAFYNTESSRMDRTLII